MVAYETSAMREEEMISGFLCPPDSRRAREARAACAARDAAEAGAMIRSAAARLPDEVQFGKRASAVPKRPAQGSPSENAHLELLALLYEHGITKGAAMEAGKGGVADIEMLRFGDDWTARLKAANAHALWYSLVAYDLPLFFHLLCTALTQDHVRAHALKALPRGADARGAQRVPTGAVEGLRHVPAGHVQDVKRSEEEEQAGRGEGGVGV